MNTLHNFMSSILILLALITVPVASLAEDIDPGLVGMWHLDGDWKDASDAGNNGSPYNGVTFSTNAKIGTMSGSFDGVDDYVLIGSQVPLTLQMQNEISLEAWIYLTQYPSDLGLIVGSQYDVNKAGATIFIDGRTNPDDQTAPPGHINLQIGDGAWHASNTKTQVPLNQWVHIVATRKANEDAKIYFNGILQPLTSAAWSGTISYAGAWFAIGQQKDLNRPFKGTLDEVAIYNRALSDTEILEHYRKYVVKSPTVNPVPSPTATSTITLSGTKPANTAIVVNGNTLVPLDGTTSWQTNYALSAGTNNLIITALDNQNFNSLPVNLTVVLDATPPQVTATTPTNNVTLKSSLASVTFTLADAFSPLDFTATLNNATVTTTSGSNVSGTWSSYGSGSTGTITFTPSAALNDERYTAIINPTDVLANGSTYTLSFTIDSMPPVAPTIDPVNDMINSSSITISGTKSSDSSSVVVSCAGAMIDTIFYPTATTWIANVSGLQEGSNSITVYAVDAAGNQSATATATITVDTIPPAVGATPAAGVYNSPQSVAISANEPAVIFYTTDDSTPTERAAIYSQPISIPVSATLKYFGRDLAGNSSEIVTEKYVIDTTPPVLSISTLSDGAYTNNETLNIAGTVTDDTDVSGITINDTDVQANADGSFSYALLLKNGANTVTVTATDSAGNIAAETRTVTLDQTAPILAVTAPADNSKTGNLLLEVSGTVDETSTVTVKMKDTVQSALMDGGAFTATIVLEPGYNTIEITATDLAGNQSSLKRTILYDDQKPSLAIIEPNQDIRTNQSSLTIKGTVNDTFTNVGVTISKDNEIFAPPVIDGTFEQTMNFTEEKTYNIIVMATNEVGTSTSVQRNVIYDITPPALSIDPIHNPTSLSCQSLRGTREARAAVTVTCATATVGEVSYPTATTWQADISGLREGKNVITAASVDAAGNAVTATATIVLSSRPPKITISATPEVIWPPNHQMVPVRITGGVNANGSAIKSVLISVSDEYGKFKYNNLAFGRTVMLEAWRKANDKDGRKYTITVVVTIKGGIRIAKTATVTVPHEKSRCKRK